MRPPDSVPARDSDGRPLVCKLRKALYGLRQAPRAWYDKLHSTLLSLGFKRSDYDSCLYLHTQAQLWLAFHVDDFLLIGPTIDGLTSLKQSLREHFEIKDFGEVRYFLGMEVVRDWSAGTIAVQQTQYTLATLSFFGMDQCHAVSTPLEASTQLVATNQPLSAPLHALYRVLIGRLNYLAVMTRPDICTAVHQLARFLSAPGEEHMVAAKHLLRYLRGTPQLGLKYSKTPSLPSFDDVQVPEAFAHSDNLNGFVDANWAPSSDTQRKSTTGYVFMLHGAAIVWYSKLQSVIALSSTEAEYIALSEAARHHQCCTFAPSHW